MITVYWNVFIVFYCLSCVNSACYTDGFYVMICSSNIVSSSSSRLRSGSSNSSSNTGIYVNSVILIINK